MTCKISTGKRKWIWEHPTRQAEYRKRVRKRREYFQRWLEAVVEFEEGRPGVESSTIFRTSSQTWENDGVWPHTSVGNLPVRAYHPGEFLAASFTIDFMKYGIEATAAACADALTQFAEIAGLACYDTEAFGPFEEGASDTPEA